MDWTAVYLQTKNYNIFILGTGEVATRRAHKFLDHGANVILVGDYLDPEIEKKGAILQSFENIEELISWADLVVIASNNEQFCDEVSILAKDKLLNRADFPQKGNLIIPNSFNISDDIEISIFTNGKSPLISKYLREKIQSIITKEDIIKLELQDYARNQLKIKVSGQKNRKKFLYNLFNDEIIEKLIINNSIQEAKQYIDKKINEGNFFDSKFKG